MSRLEISGIASQFFFKDLNMTPPIHFIIEFQINKLQKSVMLTKIAPQF
jgi:hypothetical protein